MSLLQDCYKIMVMKDIFHKNNNPDAIFFFINKLFLSQQDKDILQNKYVYMQKDKEQIHKLQISPRHFYKLVNNIHIRAYDAMKLKICNNI